MNRLYIIFPHCYIKATSKELLIYDTIKFSSIYMRNIAVPYKAVNTDVYKRQKNASHDLSIVKRLGED